MSLSLMTPQLRATRVKGSLEEADRLLSHITERFSVTADEATPGRRLHDLFPDRITYREYDSKEVSASQWSDWEGVGVARDPVERAEALPAYSETVSDTTSESLDRSKRLRVVEEGE